MELTSATLSASASISPSSSLTSQPKPPPSASSSLLNRLLGDFRPLRGFHAVAEAGGSICLCAEALLQYRLFSTCTLVFGFVLFSASGGMPETTHGAWVFYVAMGLVIFSSLRYLVAPERATATECRGTSGVLADLVVSLVQATFFAEITFAALCWSYGLTIGHRVRRHSRSKSSHHSCCLQTLLLRFRWPSACRTCRSAGAWRGMVGLCIIPERGSEELALRQVQFSSEGSGWTVAMHIGAVLGGSLVGLLALMANRLNKLSVFTTRIRRRVALLRTQRLCVKVASKALSSTVVLIRLEASLPRCQCTSLLQTGNPQKLRKPCPSHLNRWVSSQLKFSVFGCFVGFK